MINKMRNLPDFTGYTSYIVIGIIGVIVWIGSGLYLCYIHFGWLATLLIVLSAIFS
jgi:low affinity Fe/Cu permease